MLGPIAQVTSFASSSTPREDLGFVSRGWIGSTLILTKFGTPLEELKGMGRLLHIAHQTEFSLLGMEEFKKRHEKRQGDKVFSWPTGNGECYWQPLPTIFGDSAFKLSFYDDEHEGGLGDSSFGHASG